MNQCKKKYSSELWDVLAYAGTWNASPTVGTVETFEVPKSKQVFLLGIPLLDGNKGANPNLKLINFSPSTLDGPIMFTGLQSIFFNNYLDHTIKWEVEAIADCIENVKIGFYSSNYVSRDLGPNKCIPMLTNLGPAFFELTHLPAKGVFETTIFNDIYVIVDANVSVKMWIESKRPKSFTDPDLTELFKLYKYVVRDSCGKTQVVATEQLINKQTLQTLLRPTSKYIKISEWMIDYLSSKSVTITLFNEEEPTTSNLLQLTTSSSNVYKVPNLPFTFDTKLYYYIMNSSGIEGANNDNKSFAYPKDIFKYLDIQLTLHVSFKDPQPIAERIFSIRFSVFLTSFSINDRIVSVLKEEEAVVNGFSRRINISRQVETNESNFSFKVLPTLVSYSGKKLPDVIGAISQEVLNVYVTDLSFAFSNKKRA